MIRNVLRAGRSRGAERRNQPLCSTTSGTGPGARCPQRIPLRHAQPLRAVAEGHRHRGHPGRDRAAAGRGLPRHRQHRLAQRARPPGRRLGISTPARMCRAPRACRGPTPSPIRCSPSACTSSWRTARWRRARPRCCRARTVPAACPPKDRRGDLDLTFEDKLPVLLPAKAGDAILFVSDVWHRGTPAQPGSRPLLPADATMAAATWPSASSRQPRVNHLSPAAIARAETERERTLIGLHEPFFYDG